MQRVHTSSPRQLPPTGRARIHFCYTYTHTHAHTPETHFRRCQRGSDDALSGLPECAGWQDIAFEWSSQDLDEQARTYHATEREDAGFDPSAR